MVLAKSSGEVTNMIVYLKKKFRMLKSTILECIEKRKIPFTKVVDVLTSLSPDDDEHHRLFLKSNISALIRCTGRSELFQTMNFHWNYLDPSLLDNLVRELDLNEVKGEMKAYKSDLQQFRLKTPLTLFCQTQKRRRIRHPQGFLEIVAEFNMTSDEDVTLEDVEQFRQEYASHYNIHEFAMMLADVHPDSYAGL